MSLSTYQRDLFQQTFGNLLFYANDQLGIVRGEAWGDGDTEDDALCRELIARALWQHVDVIDQYLHEHASLAPLERRVVSDLRDVIYGDFVFEGSVDGLGKFVHETGSYLAHSFEKELFAHPQTQPVILRCALVPFMDQILAVVPMVTLGLAPEAHISHLKKEAARLNVQAPTSRGEHLARRGRAWRQKREEAEKAKAAASQPSSTLGAGYHRGPLAGLTETERAQACAAHRNKLARADGSYLRCLAQRSLSATAFPFTLAETLDLLDSDWLMGVAQHVANLAEPPEMARHELIGLICKTVTHDRDLRDSSLVWCEDAQFELMRRLVQHNPLPLADLQPSELDRLYPMIPYVFILHEDNSFVAWMPPEVARILGEIDLDDVAQMRRRLMRATNAAAALACQCGAISFEEAYERYRAVEQVPLSFDQFEQTLVERESCERRDSYGILQHGTGRYLVAGELSEQGLLAHVVRHHYADRIVRMPAGAPEDVMGVLIDERDELALERQLDIERAHMAQRLESLLEEHRKLPAHPLVEGMLDVPFTDYLLTTDALRQVRSYVDAHLPDDEDDYDFAETFARALVISALFEQESYDEVLDIVRLFGMSGCEGTSFPDPLGKLVTDVFNELPRWYLNGWSLAENTARLCGRAA